MRLRRHGRERGFTYFGLLVVVAIMGVMLAASGEVWHIAQKRDREQELLFVGNQFRQAITEYYEHTPAQEQRYPANLEDLLGDPRYPSTQRYLRKIYRDPVGGSGKWGLIKGPGGEIYGVRSLSEEEPVKKSNFSLADKNFEGKTKYADWVFVHAQSQQPATPSQH
ncbi:type II secretion system protein [Candidatus Ferrigenium straubiae]|jgi:type II secretory pathway pseudopilin PulG|uniref:type II secretion system protein n=1 Tax=Candidatus Ferrigenium straubiae TaxID=2919506 RepID=UPI003F4A9494